MLTLKFWWKFWPEDWRTYCRPSYLKTKRVLSKMGFPILIYVDYWIFYTSLLVRLLSLLFPLDAENALDRIAWEYIICFGPHRLSAVTTFQSPPGNPGRVSSKSFVVRPGYRTTVIAIRSCENVSGIWTCCFISHPETSLNTMLSLLNDFCWFSGYKLNLNKSFRCQWGDASIR